MTASESGMFEWGQVVLLPFPFSDQVGSKKRPGVVVSHASFNRVRPDLIIMAITSQMRPARAGLEVWLSDWGGAGLLKPSAIKPVITTIERRLVLRSLGRLGPEDGEQLRAFLQALLIR